jgi:hypothetical protein
MPWDDLALAEAVMRRHAATTIEGADTRPSEQTHRRTR